MNNNSYIYHPHPLQPTHDLVLQIPSIPHLHQQNMLHDHGFLAPQDCDPPLNTQATKSSSDPVGAQDGDNKRVAHCDLERQRRQEMNGLYSSLRSLLPLEYVKGKRSISDHMHEAARYIKHMEKRNLELRGKRDKSRRLSGRSGEAEGFCGTGFASVARSWQGVEVVVGSSMNEGAVPLSRVLGVLDQEGLAAVSCVSSKVNERLIHTVQAEIQVTDPRASGDMSGLQQKLMNLVQSMT